MLLLLCEWYVHHDNPRFSVLKWMIGYQFHPPNMAAETIWYHYSGSFLMILTCFHCKCHLFIIENPDSDCHRIKCTTHNSMCMSQNFKDHIFRDWNMIDIISNLFEWHVFKKWFVCKKNQSINSSRGTRTAWLNMKKVRKDFRTARVEHR